MNPFLHEAAPHHLPFFITAPGQTDVLMVVMAIVLVLSVLGIGVFFFWLHSLPERMVHDIVAVLALLSLFTHIHAFWVAALLLALVRFPDFSSWDLRKPLNQMAVSLDRIATADGLSQYTKLIEDAQKMHPPESATNSDSTKQET